MSETASKPEPLSWRNSMLQAINPRLLCGISFRTWLRMLRDIQAMAHGTPAVVTPLAHQQSIHAQLVVEARAAVRVRFKRVTAAELRHAVVELLDRPGYRVAARRIQVSLREASGARSAASALEQMR